MSFLLKIIGPKINVEIEKLREKMKRLANEGSRNLNGICLIHV